MRSITKLKLAWNKPVAWKRVEKLKKWKNWNNHVWGYWFLKSASALNEWLCPERLKIVTGVPKHVEFVLPFNLPVKNRFSRLFPGQRPLAIFFKTPLWNLNIWCFNFKVYPKIPQSEKELILPNPSISYTSLMAG